MKKKKLIKQIKTLQAENQLFREDLRVLVTSTHLPEVLHKVQRCRCYFEIEDVSKFGEMEKTSNGIWEMLIEQKQPKLKSTAITPEAIKEKIESFVNHTNGLEPQGMICDEFLETKELVLEDSIWSLRSFEKIPIGNVDTESISLIFQPNNIKKICFEIQTSINKIECYNIEIGANPRGIGVNRFGLYGKKYKYSELIELREKLKI